jgi:hypothetical protein
LYKVFERYSIGNKAILFLYRNDQLNTAMREDSDAHAPQSRSMSSDLNVAPLFAWAWDKDGNGDFSKNERSVEATQVVAVGAMW